MDQPTSENPRIPFNDAEAMFAGFSKDDFIELAYCAGDFMLAIDESSIVRDVAINTKEYALANEWIGKKFVDIVTVESKPKIERMLDTRQGIDATWRQVNHRHDGDDIPIKYRAIRPADGPWTIAVGRDMRVVSALQQRLLKTQQSMERDYLNLRQTETRYRLLFDNISYPVVIVDADNLQIQQANRALHALISASPGSLDGKALTSLVDDGSRDSLVAHIGAASVSNTTEAVDVVLSGQAEPVRLSMSAFRQAGKPYWLINIDDGEHNVPSNQSDRYILDAVEKMPDAFVLANANQEIIVANRAFAELVQVGSVEQLVGVSLNQFIGRPDVDLNLLRKQLKDHENVRNFSSVVNDLNGSEEPVEISAIMIERDQPLFGYSVRTIGRRERDLPTPGEELRSVDQLTELVGRKPLKEIVRESSDLIERMCIEAALIHTSDNRASAAEILGLSRQSLYSKLHRHGLGNLRDKN
ncbi:transcriptional regulator PpsR [Pontixanthobacter aestiaquae]|uniref:Transcriptional regulator PpsR n=1 Tax=Pontixanthobacter aestiaquae TaxID=1509367 RepID=A0A844Z8G6_9SPHN|nr:transcriptional regulator PpsR [Pontixanthobacter aestiaquae]MDN3644778.1 transcriptional regulator PpsR [Pontixanthobacter aestiaquae]MXO84215.1 transcriptional regulator PpsR [Pontixanthobacter aestiaquae]